MELRMDLRNKLMRGSTLDNSLFWVRLIENSETV